MASERPAGLPVDSLVRLEYEYTPDDAVAWFKHYRRTSPAVRRADRAGWITTAVIGAVALVGFLARAPRQVVWVGVFFGLFIIHLLWGRRASLRRYRRLISEGRTGGAFGPAVAEATAEGLQIRSASRAVRVAWSAVERVTETPGYVFLELGGSNALSIARASVSAGSLADFVTLARQAIAAAATQPRPLEPDQPLISAPQLVGDIVLPVPYGTILPRRHSPLAIGSVAVAILVLSTNLLVFVGGVVWFMLTSALPAWLPLCLAISFVLSGFASVVGVGLAVAAAFDKQRRQVLAWLGLGLHLGILGALAGLFWLAA